ncbi:MAG: SusC/RagA family TonB-linked outer membrane protein [Bacteroidota bacterium]
MKKNLLQFLFVLLLLGSKAYAQSKTITGTVTGKDDNAPIPGVTITVEGTKTGIVSNADGTYSIKVPAGPQTLIFSSVGYITYKKLVTGLKLDVALESNQKALSEVLVVGYGTQTKRDNIGSVTSIGGKELSEKPVQNFVQALAGQAAGVQVTSANGVLNTPPVFRIRGTNSISLSSQPLIVVDGVPSFSGDGVSNNNPLSNINPEDIESVDIAKDAAGTAIYGSRAANGVVYVTTKKGKKGRAVVSIDSYYGESKVQRLPKLLDAYQYVDMKNEALKNAGLYNAATTYFALGTDAAGNTINTKWFDYIYRTGKIYNSTLSVSGGSDNTNYYMSANFTKEGGILQKNDFVRKSLLFNVDHKANKIISLGAKLSYSNEMNLQATSAGSLSGDAFAITGLGRIPLVSPPNVSPYNNDGSYNVSGNTLGFGANKGVSTSYYNIAPILDMNRANSENNHISSNVYFQVKPLPWITAKTNYGIDYIFTDSDQFLNSFQGDGSPNGSATDNFSKNKNWVWDNTIQFDHTFLGKHSFSLLLGNEQQYQKTTGFGLSRSVLSDNAFNIIQAGFTTNAASGLTYGENYLVSFFGRFNYDFDKKYLLTATLRQDQYSGFGFNKKKGVFPGAGLGWEVAREKFWTSIGADKVFSSFKLRGSYGRVGNNAGSGNYASYGFYGNGVFNTQPTLVATQTGNDDLGWETSTKTDFGFNFGIMGDRITGDVAFFKNNNSNLILAVSLPPSAGLPSRPSVNIGSMYNKGVEFTLNADAIRVKDFSYSPSFNISYNQNKILSLSPGVTSLTASTAGNEVTNINQVGYPISNLYIIRTGGVDPATGRRIFLNGAGRKVLYNPIGGAAAWTYEDGTTAPAISQSADAVNLTNSAPKVVGGLNNTFRYKGFDLNMLFTYQLGFSLYYGTNAGLHDQRFWNNTTDVLNRWTTPGQVTDIPKVFYNDNVSNGSTLPMDANVFNGNFVKLKTVNLGYSLPKSMLQKVGISSVRFYISAYNLFVITKYPGPDPEVSSNGASNTAQGIDRNTSANQRTITGGFSVKF